MLVTMRLAPVILAGTVLLAAGPIVAQPALSQFEVASVRPSAQTVGPDYNNQVSWSATGFTARNVTLRRLIADAWNIQLDQVISPQDLDRNEYDIQARLPSGASPRQHALMLQNLLAERFNLKQHSESRTMRVYQLTAGKDGPRIKPAADAESHAVPGFHFHGDMRQFADLLAVQLSIPAPVDPGTPVRAGGPAIPVLDKTGLAGIYDFSVAIHPELNADGFTVWQRALDEQLGLRLESRKGEVEVRVVDSVARVPSAN